MLLYELHGIIENAPLWLSATVIILWAIDKFIHPIFKTAVDINQKEISELRQEVENLKALIEEMKIAHQQELKTIREKHRAEVLEIRKRHNEEMIAITQERDNTKNELSEIQGYIKGVKVFLEKEGIKI